MKLPGLQYKSPHTYTRSQRLKLLVLPPLIAYPLKALMHLNRYEVRNKRYLDDAMGQRGHALLALWHESTALLAHGYQGLNYHSTASYSFDGELAARLVTYFGAEAVRGSSSRGGSEALRELQKAIELVPCVGLTVDGPKGPRRTVKPGIAILAARAQVPILPVAAALTRRIRLTSWDRMPVPLPFGRIVVDYAPPIAPPPNDSQEEVEKTRVLVDSVLNQMQSSLEEAIGDDPKLQYA
ncbi:MAG: lysophospholipid acyltransferase family protein [Candidatus Hydrogenedentes bacterium]|nr:lysophospholipid acyltransferase family protein [Candidatus Hydrogenedentota bacterium]